MSIWWLPVEAGVVAATPKITVLAVAVLVAFVLAQVWRSRQGLITQLPLVLVELVEPEVVEILLRVELPVQILFLAPLHLRVVVLAVKPETMVALMEEMVALEVGPVEELVLVRVD